MGASVQRVWGPVEIRTLVTGSGRPIASNRRKMSGSCPLTARTRGKVRLACSEAHPFVAGPRALVSPRGLFSQYVDATI